MESPGSTSTPPQRAEAAKLIKDIEIIKGLVLPKDWALPEGIEARLKEVITNLEMVLMRIGGSKIKTWAEAKKAIDEGGETFNTQWNGQVEPTLESWASEPENVDTYKSAAAVKITGHMAFISGRVEDLRKVLAKSGWIFHGNRATFSLY